MGRHSGDLDEIVLQFIEQFIANRGYSPSVQEIREALHFRSKSHVHYYLKRLSEDGEIEWEPNKARSLRLKRPAPGLAAEPGKDTPAALYWVPIEGNIAAGLPIEHLPSGFEQIAITSSMADPGPGLYALRVKGSSMVDAMVCDGDLVIVERWPEVPAGHMAVVYLREENAATLKKVFPDGDRVRLQPAHPTMEAFYVDAKDVEIQGRVVAVLRAM